MTRHSLAPLLCGAAALMAAASSARAQISLTLAGASGNNSTQTTAFGIAPSAGSTQNLLTTINPASNLPAGYGTQGANTDVAALNAFFGLAANTLSSLGAQDGSGYLTAPVFLAAGSTVRFDWVFLTDEDNTRPTTPPPAAFHDDLAFFTVNGTINRTLQKASQLGADRLDAEPDTIFSYRTASYQTATYTALASGNYTFGFGVLDVGTNTIKSGLLIDNLNYTAVPEPSTWALLGVGTVSLGVVIARRRHRTPFV